MECQGWHSVLLLYGLVYKWQYYGYHIRLLALLVRRKEVVKIVNIIAYCFLCSQRDDRRMLIFDG